MSKEFVSFQMCPIDEVLVIKLLVTDETTDDQIRQGLIGVIHIASHIDFFAPEGANPTKFLVAIGIQHTFITRDSDAQQKFDKYAADRAKSPRLPVEVV